MWKSTKKVFKDYFLAGILVLGPLTICYLVVRAIIEGADNALNTAGWMPVRIPGIGVLVALIIILFAGFLGRNLFGRYLFNATADVLGRVPILGNIYKSTRQVFQTLFVNQGNHFSRVVLIEFPSRIGWSLAFVTSEVVPIEVQKLFSEKLLSVYVPTTPIPTNGFYIYLAQKDVRDTELSVEQAFKIIVSLGLVVPDEVAAPV